MCDRLIQLSFAKIVNSKNEKGGAKLRKNLLILRLLQQAKNELKYRQSHSQTADNNLDCDKPSVSSIDKIDDKSPTDDTLISHNENVSIITDNNVVMSGCDENAKIKNCTQYQDENSMISSTQGSESENRNNYTGMISDRDSNIIKQNGLCVNNKRSIEADDSEQCENKKVKLSHVAVYVGSFHYTASAVVQFACSS